MLSDGINKHQLHISGKEVDVYPSTTPDCPIIYLNTFQKEGDRVYQVLRNDYCPDFTLVAISGLEWDHDMAPWDIPAISKNDTPCTGGDDDYLRFLSSEIIPKVERGISVSWRGITGYSLAGLFAVYALYQTELFERVATMSGSMWFPDFKEYIFSHEMKRQPECIYFSLGDRECKTKNPYLKTVQEDTEAIHSFYQQKGIDTKYQINPGNHFQNGIQRTASGISWILSR